MMGAGVTERREASSIARRRRAAPPVARAACYIACGDQGEVDFLAILRPRDRLQGKFSRQQNSRFVKIRFVHASIRAAGN
jgi:hypothetical protein